MISEIALFSLLSPTLTFSQELQVLSLIKISQSPLLNLTVLASPTFLNGFCT